MRHLRILMVYLGCLFSSKDRAMSERTITYRNHEETGKDSGQLPALDVLKNRGVKELGRVLAVRISGELRERGGGD
jgi:hypothetical protein